MAAGESADGSGSTEKGLGCRVQTGSSRISCFESCIWVMVEKLKHLLAHALINLVRAGWGGLASITSIAVSFLIIGIFLLLVQHFNALVAEWKEQLQVSVFLDDRVTPMQLEMLRRRIENEAAVKVFTFTTKEEALANFRRELKGHESLLEGLGDNPLPASFQLKIR